MLEERVDFVDDGSVRRRRRAGRQDEAEVEDVFITFVFGGAQADWLPKDAVRGGREGYGVRAEGLLGDYVG